MKEKGKDHYNIGYAKLNKRSNRYYQRRKDLFDAILNHVDENSNVLDIGCGNGVIGYLLSEKINKYYGIDYSSKAIDFAKERKLKNNIVFICDDVYNFKWISMDYDTLLLIEFLEHTDYGESVIEKIKSETKIIISVPLNEKEGSIPGKPKSYPTHREIYHENTILDKYNDYILFNDPIIIRHWIIYVGVVK